MTMTLYRALLEESNFSEPVSVGLGTLYTENRRHFWTNMTNYCLLTFKILQNLTSVLF